MQKCYEICNDYKLAEAANYLHHQQTSVYEIFTNTRNRSLAILKTIKLLNYIKTQIFKDATDFHGEFDKVQCYFFKIDSTDDIANKLCDKIDNYTRFEIFTNDANSELDAMRCTSLLAELVEKNDTIYSLFLKFMIRLKIVTLKSTANPIIDCDRIAKEIDYTINDITLIHGISSIDEESVNSVISQEFEKANPEFSGRVAFGNRPLKIKC